MTLQNIKNKATFSLFIGILLPSVVSAQAELTFVATRDTIAHNVRTSATVVLRAGDAITTNAAVSFGQLNVAGDMHLTIIFGEPDNQYMVLAKDFRPVNAEDVFGEDIFVDFPLERDDGITPTASGSYVPVGDVDTMWVPSYYADILLGQNRDRLLEIYPWLEYLADMGFAWHENSTARIRLGRAMFYDSVIQFGPGSHFAVRNIIRTDFGYIVDCVVSTLGAVFPNHTVFPERTFSDTFDPGEELTFFINLDGDHLDIYVNDRERFLGAFIRVGREFIKQYQSLMRTNTADLTNVLWPRRADGTMDFPPPGIDMSGFEASHATTARLRIRDNPATDSPIVTTLDLGTEVQVLETGPVKTIGGTTAPWVRVLTANGFTGWAFSAFLESTTAPAELEIHEPPVTVAATPVEPPAPVPQNDAASTPMPLWLTLAIAGAAVVVIGGAVLFLIRRKV